MESLTRDFLTLFVGVLVSALVIFGLVSFLAVVSDDPSNDTAEACVAQCSAAGLPVAAFERESTCVCGTQPYTRSTTTVTSVPVVVPVATGGR